MAQVFSRYINMYAKASIVVVGLLVGGLASGWALYMWSPYVTGQHVYRDQPVQFTHEHHVAGLGIDCRYCHINVENSSFAGIPPTKICMNCHSQLWTDAAILEPVRESYRTEESIRWTRVHNLADFVYFNHSIHVNKGIGCAECHGRVDKMPLMFQENNLTMSWCLSCHKSPDSHVRPRSEIVNMGYEKPSGAEGTSLTQALVKEYHVQSKISCSVCHR